MLPAMRSRVLIAELDAAVAAHLAGQLAEEVYEVVPVNSSGAVFGQVLAGDVAAIVLALPDSADVLRDLPDAGFEGGVVVVDVPTSPGDVTSTSLEDAAAGRPVLLLHHLDHLASAVEQVIELSGGGSREEVDVPATVAWVLAQHAPGTHMEGPSSGGVQVIRATLDPEAFDAFLVAVAASSASAAASASSTTAARSASPWPEPASTPSPCSTSARRSPSSAAPSSSRARRATRSPRPCPRASPSGSDDRLRPTIDPHRSRPRPSRDTTKAPRSRGAFVDPCARGDLNPHALSDTGT